MPNHTIFNERPECQDRMIELLKRMGYQYVSRAEAEEKRGKLTNVLFEDELVRFLKKQTYHAIGQEFNFSGESILKAVREINVPLAGGLLPTSKIIYDLLTLGISVTEKIPMLGGEERKQDIDLHYIDFQHPDNNIFQVTEEFSVEKLNGEHRRPDIVLMINGIPIGVIECKKSAVDISAGIRQNCKNMLPDAIPDLFKFAQIIVAINPNKAKYGTCGTEEKWFSEWKEKPRTDEYNELLNKFDAKSGNVQDEFTVSLFEKRRVLNLVKNYILYDAGEKKIARYQQFFAIESTIARLKGTDGSGHDKGGVIWHTQGSGKSLTMVMLVKRIMTEFANENPRFVMITDRIDLDKQLTLNFAKTGLEPKRANTGSQLVEYLEKRHTVITTIINKFETAVKNKHLAHNDDRIFVLVDEAHRSQYGMRFNEMRDVLPKSQMVAFTGTPLIAKEDKQTAKQFGSLIHSYTMRDGIEDGIIVPLVYGSRMVRQAVVGETTLDELFDEITQGLSDEDKEEYKAEYSRYSRLALLDARIAMIAKDIYKDFKKTCLPKGLKAMVACSSRASAVEMYHCLKKFSEINPIVSISFTEQENKLGEADDDTAEATKKIADYHKAVVEPKWGNNDEKYYEHLLNSFTSDGEGSYNILIVKDKHLTGFDAPIVGTLYLDKSIKEHNILQAIARANRIYKTKDVGIIVDYYGVLKKLKEALELYDNYDEKNFGKEDFANALYSLEDAKQNLEKTHKELTAIFAEVVLQKLKGNELNAAYQETLNTADARENFNIKMLDFEKHLYLAQSNRQIYVLVGADEIKKYNSDWLFYKKLQASVKQRFEKDEIDESGKVIKPSDDVMIDLLDQFVSASEVKEILKPFLITDEDKMKRALKQIGVSKKAQADLIKTKVESKLRQVRYDDPLLFEEFSAKIRKTIDEYEKTRNEDAYLDDIERIADDFKNGLEKQSYPTSIMDDSDSKALYGSIANEIKKKGFPFTLVQEEIAAAVALKIKSMLTQKTKKDWKHNVIVQKEIKRELDDILFDMFGELSIEINEKNVELIDLIIDEVLKIAIMRF